MFEVIYSVLGKFTDAGDYDGLGGDGGVGVVGAPLAVVDDVDGGNSDGYDFDGDAARGGGEGEGGS